MATERPHVDGDLARELYARAVHATSERLEVLGLTVHGAASIATTLRMGSTAQAEDETKRRALIEAINAGQHVELEIEAIVFRQKDGIPNRKGVRVSPDSLESFAASFVGMPILVDHNQGTQAARIGTILASTLEHHGGTGWSQIRQRMRIVKPSAVISVLDGTIDQWSVGMLPGSGDVICSVHRTAILESCYCWRLEEVEVDGSTQTVEWEFTKPEGVETSSVNVPAVKGTKVDDVRQALALALDIPALRHEPARMNWTRLATILGLSAIGANDEARVVTAFEDERRARLAAEQERDSARTSLTETKAVLAARDVEIAAGREVRVKGILDAGYAAGKWTRPRDAEGKTLANPMEAQLRLMADLPDGIAKLQALIDGMPEVVPVGKRVDIKPDTQPKLNAGGGGSEINGVPADVYAELLAASKKTGQDINELCAGWRRLKGY
jgi:hypothetical protein